MKTALCACVLACTLVLLFPGSASSELFTLVILPDTQYYTDECNSRDIYLHQAQWIVANKDFYNIKYVAHMGDVTDNSAQAMWDIAVEAHTALYQAGIPFGLVLGNHDYDTEIFLRGAPDYTAKFGSGNFPQWYEGRMGSGIENTYSTFGAEGFVDSFLVLNLEYAPRGEVICWADSVIERHNTHRVIVVTHCYSAGGGSRCDCTYEPKCAVGNPIEGGPCLLEEPPVIGSDGWHLWDELIQRHSNIVMVLSGHKNDSEYTARTGLAGNTVHEILTDYQDERPLNAGDKCGNGWLRLLVFDTTQSSVSVQTVSVEDGNTSIFPGGVPRLWESAYDSDPTHVDHEYSFAYDMSAPVGPDIHVPLDHFHDRTVNTRGAGDQQGPAIAVNPATGDYVVVWEQEEDNSIYMRGFDATGRQRFPETRVSDLRQGWTEDPDVAMDGQGNFVVVWTDGDGLNHATNNIIMEGFDADGNSLFTERGVASNGSHDQRRAAVAMSMLSGDFVVVWEDDSNANEDYTIYGRGFSLTGEEQFPDTRMNLDYAGEQEYPDVAIDAGGRFVVVWRDKHTNIVPPDDLHIECRRFQFPDPAGPVIPQSSDMIVNSTEGGEHVRPAIGMDQWHGDYVVVWQYDGDNDGIWAVQAREFKWNGTPKGNQFSLGFSDGGIWGQGDSEEIPAVSMNVYGRWICTYRVHVVTLGQPNNEDYIFADGYDGNGTNLFSPLEGMKVNSHTFYPSASLNPLACEGKIQAHRPDVAMRTDGSFVSVWQDDSDCNGGDQIVARAVQFYDLTVTSGAGGSAFVEGVRSLPSGWLHDVWAGSDPGMRFSHWTGGAENPTAQTTKVFIDGNRTVTAWFLPDTVATGVGDPPSPPSFALHQNVPNPFNPETVIRYDVPENGGMVTLRIYDVAGRLVKTLIDGQQTAGGKSAAWNGTNNRGSRVASGVYFYRMTAPGFESTRKMVLLQ